MSLNIQQTIKNLQQAIIKQDHNEAYEYSKLLLKQSPDDEQYQQCLIISALKIHLFQQLQTVFKTNPSKQSIQKLYAYYLYNAGEYDKTIIYLQNLIKSSKNDKNIQSYRLLLAQSYFKMNQPGLSARIMLQLLQSQTLSHQDLQMYLVNLFATLINKQLDQGIVARYKNITKQSNKYCKQVYYNYGLLLITLEDYQNGMECLKLFESQLKKGEDDNDIIMVNVVKDYVSYKQGNNNGQGMDVENDSKVKEYQKMEEEIKQINLKSVIKNNLVFFKYQNSQHLLENYHDIVRIIDQGLDKKSKITKPQQFILKLNKFILLLRKNRLPDAAKLLKDLESNFQADIFLNSNIAFLKGKYSFLKKTKDSNKQGVDLYKYIKSLQKLHKNLAFCLLADLKKQQNKQTDLINELKQPHAPVIKNYIFSLLIKNPDLFEQYHEYLDELLIKTSDIKILDILLKLYQNKKDLVKQQAVLTKILKINPKDVNNKVKMAQIYVRQGQMLKVQQLLRGVQEPQEINDINYLQNIEKNIHISIKKQEQVIVDKKNTQNKENVNKNNHTDKKRIKKKRRPRLPKNIQRFVEGFKADPQRWLPKWQRKGYKKKGKKGTGKTQGLATVGKEQTKNVFTTGASTSAKQVTKQVQKKKK